MPQMPTHIVQELNVGTVFFIYPEMLMRYKAFLLIFHFCDFEMNMKCLSVCLIDGITLYRENDNSANL